MQFAYTIAKKLSSFPLIKQIVKDTYAFVGNCLSDRKSDIQGLRMVSSASRPHNFGYYDKCPWSADQRYMIYLSPADAVSNYVTAEAVEIILYDFSTGLGNRHCENACLEFAAGLPCCNGLVRTFKHGFCSMISAMENIAV